MEWLYQLEIERYIIKRATTVERCYNQLATIKTHKAKAYMFYLLLTIMIIDWYIVGSMRTIYVVDYQCEYRLHLEYERSKRSDCLLINLLFHQHGIIGFWEKKRIAFAVEITENDRRLLFTQEMGWSIINQNEMVDF